MGVEARFASPLIIGRDYTSFLRHEKARTDLLSPYPEVGLDQLTTEIGFSDLRFEDVAVPLWLRMMIFVLTRFHCCTCEPRGSSGSRWSGFDVDVRCSTHCVSRIHDLRL